MVADLLMPLRSPFRSCACRKFIAVPKLLSSSPTFSPVRINYCGVAAAWAIGNCCRGGRLDGANREIGVPWRVILCFSAIIPASCGPSMSWRAGFFWAKSWAWVENWPEVMRMPRCRAPPCQDGASRGEEFTEGRAGSSGLVIFTRSRRHAEA